MTDIKTLKNHSIYLAPKNDKTILLQNVLLENGFKVLGFIDNFKSDSDVYKENIFNDNNIVILYSPNYYKEIIETINTKQIYLLEEPVSDIDFNLTLAKDFQGYKQIIKPEKSFNSYEVQKEFWEDHLKDSYKKRHKP